MTGHDLRTDDFDYHLPRALIASRPLERREAARMMVIDRASGTISHRQFGDFASFMADDDLVVFNDTRVVRARFHSDDGRTELLRLESLTPGRWRCLVRPGRRLRQGNEIIIGGARGLVADVLPDGSRVIVWDAEPDESVHGHLALPHYIRRPDDETDADRYQTIFSKPGKAGALAAPTAGLHFTADLLKRLPHAFVTLHVGVGTFQPVRTQLVRDHVMHSERFEIPRTTAGKITAARRVIAVGTTVTRVLEHRALEVGQVTAGRGETAIFIWPGFKFRVVGALLTNFHLPKSTLLMLVSAFGGRDLIRAAYQEAVRERYRFYSYGDCMLIR
jgi:S-adenosylmethionine:tRNA ribosyltransferase-isomerase